MDDFQNSVAQEDVQFITELVTEVVVGENYNNLMVFIEKTKYILDEAAFTTIAGDVSKAIVTVDNYALVTKGLLKSWLDDFFAVQVTAKAYLFTICPALTVAGDYAADEKLVLESTFATYKALGFWKTILLTVDDDLLPAACADLSVLCRTDPLLSSPALLPYLTTTPITPSTDPVYAAINTAEGSALLACHYNVNRNGALLQLSHSLAVLNASGTPVGNSFDFVQTLKIDASGPLGTPLTVAVQDALKAAKISYFKPIGDTLGTVIMYGATSLDGKVIPADWIVKYCNFVNKVKTAKYITKMNTLRNNNVYQGILLIMSATVGLFTTKSGSGRLTDYTVTAPPFEKLPVSGSTITVPNAWSATYVDNVRKVNVYGQLTVNV